MIWAVKAVGGKPVRDGRTNTAFADDDFKKSSWSKNNPKTCVTVAIGPSKVAIRDSKDQNNSTLNFTRDEWFAFIQGVKDGEFDLV